MEFLLLLSAFLSALTGAITGVRGPDLRPGQVMVASSAVQAAKPAVAGNATERPSANDLGLSHHLDADSLAAFSIVAAVPLYAHRLRV